jgi:hypothetical protein
MGAVAPDPLKQQLEELELLRSQQAQLDSLRPNLEATRSELERVQHELALRDQQQLARTEMEATRQKELEAEVERLRHSLAAQQDILQVRPEPVDSAKLTELQAEVDTLGAALAAQADAAPGTVSSSNEAASLPPERLRSKKVARAGPIRPTPHASKDALQPGTAKALPVERVAIWQLTVLGKVLDYLEKLIREPQLDSALRFSERTGHVAVVGVQLLIVASIFVAAIKLQTPRLLLAIVPIAVAMAVVLFLAAKFFPIGAARVRHSRGRSSESALRALRWILLAGGLLALFLGIIAGIQFESASFTAMGCGGLSAGVLAVTLLSARDMLGLDLEDSASAGEEALALLSVPLRLLVLVAPVVYLATGVVALFLIGRELYYFVFPDESRPFAPELLVDFSAVGSGFLIPLISYLIFLVGYLLLDLLVAIFDIRNATRTTAEQLPRSDENS